MDRQDPGTHENREPVAAEPLHIDTTVAGTETVMAIAGQFDISSADLFGVSVGAVLEKRPRSMTIDARGLTFVDSSGLRSLLLARDAAIAAGVPFHVSEPSPVLRNLAERTGVRPLLLDD